MLEISSYGVLLSYMWYTKRLLFFPYLCYGLARMLSSSYPPSAPIWSYLSSGIGSLPVVGIPVQPLLVFETFFVSKGISSLVEMN
jgi:hypothetical protein